MTKVRIAIQDFTSPDNIRTRSKTIVTKLSYEKAVAKVFAFFESLGGDAI